MFLFFFLQNTIDYKRFTRKPIVASQNVKNKHEEHTHSHTMRERERESTRKPSEILHETDSRLWERKSHTWTCLALTYGESPAGTLWMTWKGSASSWGGGDGEGSLFFLLSETATRCGEYPPATFDDFHRGGGVENPLAGKSLFPVHIFLWGQSELSLLNLFDSTRFLNLKLSVNETIFLKCCTNCSWPKKLWGTSLSSDRECWRWRNREKVMVMMSS